MSSRSYPLRAIVLRSRVLGEKDRVLVLLSSEKGKLSVAARGARNPKSKLAAVAQPFTLAKFLIAKGRSLDIASQAEVENAHTHLAGDLVKSSWASYFCELADAVPEGLPESDLFELLETTLHALDASYSADDSELIGRWYEAKFLMLLGYAPTIGHCVACGTKISIARDETERRVLFSPSLGGTLCATCAISDSGRMNLRAQSLRALHQLGRAPSPPFASQFFAQLELGSAARGDLREVLRRSLQAHLDIKLKTRAFLDEILHDSQGA